MDYSICAIFENSVRCESWNGNSDKRCQCQPHFIFETILKFILYSANIEVTYFKSAPSQHCNFDYYLNLFYLAPELQNLGLTVSSLWCMFSLYDACFPSIMYVFPLWCMFSLYDAYFPSMMHVFPLWSMKTQQQTV